MRWRAPTCSSGLSAGKVAEDAIATMADNAIIFALANPDPEVPVEVARRHAAVVATGRSDYPNQINNVLAFPGVFAGAFDAGAREITENMKLAAAEAIGAVVEAELTRRQDRADAVRSAGRARGRGRGRGAGREGRRRRRSMAHRRPSALRRAERGLRRTTSWRDRPRPDAVELRPGDAPAGGRRPRAGRAAMCKAPA